MKNPMFHSIVGYQLIFVCSLKFAVSLPPLLSEDSSSLSLNRSYIDFYYQPQDTVAVKAQPITLNCEIGVFSPNNVPVNTSIPGDVTWFKDDIKLTLDGIFTKRTLFENGSLYISKAMHNIDGYTDAGQYVCQVKYRLKILRSRKAKVKVAVFNRSPMQLSQSTSASVGSCVRFNCTFTRADPLPIITWYKGRRVIGSNAAYQRLVSKSKSRKKNPLNPESMLTSDTDTLNPSTVGDFTAVLPNGMLEISRLSLDDGGEYHCTGQNPARTRPSSYFTLTVTSESSVTQEHHFFAVPSSTSSVAGSNVFFECSVSGHIERPIKWFKNTTEIDFRSSEKHKLIGQGSLIIEDVVPSDEGEYSCVVENIDPPLVASAMLSVLEPPIFLQKSKHVHYAHLGCEIAFHCNVTGNPPPSVTWYKDGNLVTESSSENVEIQNNVLSNHVTSYNDEGIYQCFAQNDAGQTQVTYQLVIVDGDTSREQSGISNQGGVLRLDDVTTSGAVISWPQFGLLHPTSYLVQVDDAQADRHQVLIAQQPRITLNELQPGHIVKVSVVPQTLLCHGPSSKILTFTVSGRDSVSGSVLNFAADAISSTSILVSWDPPATDRTVANPRYKIVMEETGGENPLMKEKITPQTSFEFKGLRKYTSYQFKVAAIDPKGIVGPFTPLLASQTQEDAPDFPPSNFTVISESIDSAFLRWAPPSNSSINGVLRGYRIKYKNMRTRRPYTVVAGPHATRYTLKKLRKNNEYSVKIQTLNNVGQSSWSRKLTFLTQRREIKELVRPGQPSLLDTQRTADEIVVMWAPPEGDTYVREYIIGWGKTNPYEFMKTIDGKLNYFRITDLEPSTQYFIRVRAGNRAGMGMEYLTTAYTKALEDSIVEPFPPLGVHVDVLTDTTLNVSWHDPDKKKQARYYVVRYKTNVPDEPRVRNINATDLNCLIHGLRPHTLYEISVKVVQGNMRSTWSMTEAAITDESEPGSAPTDLTVMPLEDKPTSVQLNWQPPEKPNGELNGYLIFYTTDQSDETSNWVIEPVVGDRLSTTIGGLTLDTQYYFKALARNGHGVGPYSEVVEYKTPKGAQVDQVTSPPWNMPNWMWYVIIGGVGLLVIAVVLIGTVVVCRNRRSSRLRSKNRKQTHNISRSSANGLRSMSSDSWPMSAQSNVSAASMRLLRPEDHMELRSIRTTSGRHASDYPSHPYRNQSTSEFTPLNGTEQLYHGNYPYLSHHSNLNDLARSPTDSGLRYAYPSKDQYGNGMLPMPPLQQPQYERGPYDIECNYQLSNTTPSPQDFTGDSAYGSDHQHHHPAEDHATTRQGRSSTAKKHNQYYQDNQPSSHRSIPSSESLDSARDSQSISVASDDDNHNLANVVAFVRDMKAQDGIHSADVDT